MVTKDETDPTAQVTKNATILVGVSSIFLRVIDLKMRYTNLDILFG